MELADNYNSDFMQVHETIVGRLKKHNDKGLVLLHGKPGTGKTTYIRYLIGLVEKKVIFLPPNMTNQITNPALITLLIENPNSVLVIEDAEEVILERSQHGSTAVSALLNLTDGFLAECLHVQIICSFNTNLSKIDKALLRKGRLIASYEFKELEIEKAQKLSDNLGRTNIISEPMVITDIYNQAEDTYNIESKVKIGFC
jgi:energy-coupling factor transporter ATP-binding protein EcfA2